MNGTNFAEQSLKSRSSSGERDDSFEILCFDEESDAESDSFTEVTVEEIKCLENRKKDEKRSVFNLPARVLKYFKPTVAADPAEEVDDEIYFVELMEEEEKESSKELPEPASSRLTEREPNNNEGPLEEKEEDSEVEYNFPELDREEMYLKARPRGLGKRRRCPRSMVKLKSPRNVIQVV